jgi:hypothetical protein
MASYSILKVNGLRFNEYCRLSFGSIFDNVFSFRLLVLIILLLGVFTTPPVYSVKWVEIDEGLDSGDTYLWPYFYTATRFVDIESIDKKDDFVIYRELIDSKKAISSNVLSLIVEKKSRCDGQKVLWKHFAIYGSAMGEGKPIMRLNPNEMQEIKKGSSGFLSDSFVCTFQ